MGRINCNQKECKHNMDGRCVKNEISISENWECIDVVVKELVDTYESYPFNQLTKWGWFKLWLTADVPYFFMSLWWKITRKYDNDNPDNYKETCPECGNKTELLHGNNTKLCAKCVIGYYENLKWLAEVE